MNEQNRRSFLKAISCSFATAVFQTSFGKAAPTKSYYFLEESTPIDRPVVLGLLMTSNPTKLNNALKQLRLQHHYKCKLRYSSTDKFKVPYASAAINYFLNEPTLTFYARIIGGSISTNERDHHDKTNSVNLVSLRKMLLANTNPQANIKLLTKWRGDIMDVRERLIGDLESNKVKLEIETIGDDFYNLIELADLLTGSVCGDGHTESRPKADLISLIKSKLKIQEFSQLATQKLSEKFRIDYGIIR